MTRRFIEILPKKAGLLDLDEDHFRHLIKALRLQVGDQFTLFDSNSYEAIAQIESIENKGLTVKIETPKKINREPKCEVTLAVALPKGEKIDWVLQKATELGVSHFFLFISKRSVSRPKPEKIEGKLKRWNQIIQAACAQSGRAKVPNLEFFHKFNDMLAKVTTDTRLCLSPESKNTLSGQTSPLPSSVTLLIGPEGGLEKTEEAEAEKHRFQKVRFGSLIYRAETAAIVAVVPFVLD